MKATNHLLTTLAVLPVLLLPACSGGGGGSAPANPNAPATAAVQLLLDTATGGDAFVEAQVAAAALLRPDGSYTDNLLPTPQLLTLADPTGDVQGLRLLGAPAGSYRALRLLLAPGSGVAVLGDGSRVPVDFASADLGIAFAADIVHGSSATTAIAASNAAAATLPPNGGRIAWAPQLRGGAAGGTTLAGTSLSVQTLQAASLTGGFAGTDDHGVHLEFEHGAELLDDRGGLVGDLTTFLGSLSSASELSVFGVLDDHGGLRGQRVRHLGDDHGGSSTRLLGRITSLDSPNVRFGMDVLAEVLHGDRSYLATPEPVTVTAGSASIHASDTWASLSFGDLRIGDLVKVRWSARTGAAVTASAVELESRSGASASPEIEGLVSEVRLASNMLVVVPRGNDPLLVNGSSVASAEITITASTRIERDASGAPSQVIQLGDIVANQDRIWIRGTASGPSTVVASWIRVRNN